MSSRVEGSESLPAEGLPRVLQDPLGLLRRRWLGMTTIFALGVLASVVAVLLLLKHSYVARAQVIVATPPVAEDFVPSAVEEEAAARINTMVAETLSRERLLQLAERHDLYPALRREATRATVVDVMRADIRISPEKGIAQRRYDEAPRIFNVAYVAGDPAVAAAVANDLAAALTSTSADTRSQQARTTTDFLREELARAEASLNEHRLAMEQFRGRSHGRRHLRELDLRLDALRKELARTLTLYTEEHPSVITLRAQILRVEGELRTASESAVRPALRRELAALKEKEEALGEAYVEALAKVRQAELAEKLETSQQDQRTTVLEWAEAPALPERSRRNFAAAGVVLSAMLALAYGLLREIQDPVLSHSEALTTDFGLPVLGSVPQIR